ncbi:MAG TPA: hypothetical protein VHC97_05160 [Thermoanaerobaculia bacterium]|jgi:hypothetical protein|nr:hypothetical protein [Thermoanaerobaculia bacterium]
MKNRKIASTVILSAVFAILTVFPVRAGAAEKGNAVPSVESVLSCNVSPAEPASPAADTETQVAPSADLFVPEPTYVCFTGWCSSDTQCVEWFGPGSRCIKKSGAACGQCSAQP